MITLHFHLQPQYKYELFHINFICALCVRARTMHGLEMHLMFCYKEF